MRTRQELLEFVTGADADSVTVLLALRGLLVGADAEGVTDRGEWVAGVRRALARTSRATGGEGPISLEASETARQLEERALPSLESAGVAAREPEGKGWERIRIEPELWATVQPDRDALVEEIQRSVRDLMARRRASVHVSRKAGPTEHGSRLWAQGLTKIYKKRKVVNDVDISVQQGEIVGLLGPNGAGKTTTFYMIVGLIPPNEGTVHLDDRELTQTPMYKRARLGVGYLAQEPSIFRKLTVEENVRAILETLKLPKKQEKERLEELLDELSIAHLRKSKAYSLSGGERRRLEITRALVQRPKFMLLDEPFAGIDPIAVNDIQTIVAELKTRDIGIIISDHNVEQTLEIVDRAYIMFEGRIRVSGTVSELVWNDEVAEIYLGPALTQRMRKRFHPPTARV